VEAAELVEAEVWLLAGSDGGVEVAAVWLLWSADGAAVVVVVVVVEVVVVPGWVEVAVAEDWAVLGAAEVVSAVVAAGVVDMLAADDGAEPVLVQRSATSVTLLTWKAFEALVAVEVLALEPEVESGVAALLVLLAELASCPDTSTSCPTLLPRLSMLPVRL
jgi:hypothetical protein